MSGTGVDERLDLEDLLVDVIPCGPHEYFGIGETAPAEWIVRYVERKHVDFLCTVCLERWVSKGFGRDYHPDARWERL